MKSVRVLSERHLHRTAGILLDQDVGLKNAVHLCMYVKKD